MGAVAATNWHLKAIGSNAPECREARELVKEAARRQRQSELAARQPTANSSTGHNNVNQELKTNNNIAKVSFPQQ